MKTDVAKMTKHELAAYIDREALPFIRINEKAVAAGRQPPFRHPRMEAIKYEIIQRPDGGIEKRRRHKPLLAEIGEVSNQWLIDTRINEMDSSKMYSGMKRGKYNDDDLSDILNPCSLEIGEVESFRSVE